MHHKSFLAGLSPQQRTALTQRSDKTGLLHLVLHGGLIVLLGVLIAVRIPFWWVLLLPQGILLAFLFTLQHEATHKTPFASEGLNEWVGRMAGLLIVQPFEWFRYFHLAHHRYTDDPQRDPELAKGKPESWVDFAWHLSAISYWHAKITLLWRQAFGSFDEDYLPARTLPRIRREARVMLAIYVIAIVCSATISPILLWVWLVPLLLGFPVLRLYLLAEHGRCPFVADMFDNTRTTYTNKIVRFVAWNMPYHAEHHVYPQVPFHRLPQLHRLTEEHLRQTETGYAAFTRHYVGGFD